jgi:hypothetical protein
MMRERPYIRMINIYVGREISVVGQEERPIQFSLVKWLPFYLKCYLYAFRNERMNRSSVDPDGDAESGFAQYTSVVLFLYLELPLLTSSIFQPSGAIGIVM